MKRGSVQQKDGHWPRSARRSVGHRLPVLAMQVPVSHRVKFLPLGLPILFLLISSFFLDSPFTGVDLMEVKWIPCTQNERADYLSKIVDYDEWTVKDRCFHAVTFVWGSCSVDCLASYKNHRVPRFYSKYFNSGSLCVGSLAFSWVSETCWLVPPVSLVKKVILHVCLCRCRRILVVPYWPSAHYWPLLVERRGVFKSFVEDCLHIENGKDVFLHGGNKSSPFWIREFLYPSAFSAVPRFCAGIVIGCCRVVGRCATGSVYDERTSFLPVHEYCPFLRHWLFCM